MEERGSDTSSGGVKGFFGRLSTGEMILALGAAWIFVVVFVIGNRFYEDYDTSVLVMVTPMVMAILAAMYLYHAGGDGSWRSLYPGLVVAVAWGVVILVALDLLNGFTNSFKTGEFYETTLYIATVAMAVGAYQVGQDGQRVSLAESGG